MARRRVTPTTKRTASMMNEAADLEAVKKADAWIAFYAREAPIGGTDEEVAQQALEFLNRPQPTRQSPRATGRVLAPAPVHYNPYIKRPTPEEFERTRFWARVALAGFFALIFLSWVGYQALVEQPARIAYRAHEAQGHAERARMFEFSMERAEQREKADKLVAETCPLERQRSIFDPELRYVRMDCAPAR